MELTGYLAVARRWWWTLIVATWVAGFAGFLVASRITPVYEAQVQLLVGPINTDINTLKASGQLVQTYAQLATSTPLLKSTAQEFPGIDPVKLGTNVRTIASDVTRVLQIKVQDSDPARAAQIANGMADELIQLTSGATTRPEGQVEVIGSAVAPTSPIAPQVSLLVLLAAAAGLLGGLILVIVVEYATDTVRDRSDLARLSGTEVLGTIGFGARRPGVDTLPVPEASAATSSSAVAFRILASKVAFADGDQPTRSVAVAGVSDGDSGVVAMGIAAAVAGSGQRAVVIDGSADGDITETLGLGGVRGLREIIAGDGGTVRTALVPGPAGVQVLPRGVTGTVELIAVDRAREVLDELLREFDLVVIDGGSMQRSAGALSWARAAQEAILLVRRSTSRREDLRLAMESLRFVNSNIGGTILVQRSSGRFGRRRQPATRLALPAMPAASAVANAARPARSFDVGPETDAALGRPFAVEPAPTLPSAPPRPAATPTVIRTASARRVAEARPIDPLLDSPSVLAPSDQPPSLTKAPSPDDRPVRRTTSRPRRAD